MCFQSDNRPYVRLCALWIPRLARRLVRRLVRPRLDLRRRRSADSVPLANAAEVVEVVERVAHAWIPQEYHSYPYSTLRHLCKTPAYDRRRPRGRRRALEAYSKVRSHSPVRRRSRSTRPRASLVNVPRVLLTRPYRVTAPRSRVYSRSAEGGSAARGHRPEDGTQHACARTRESSFRRSGRNITGLNRVHFTKIQYSFLLDRQSPRRHPNARVGLVVAAACEP